MCNCAFHSRLRTSKVSIDHIFCLLARSGMGKNLHQSVSTKLEAFTLLLVIDCIHLLAKGVSEKPELNIYKRFPKTFGCEAYVGVG